MATDAEITIEIDDRYEEAKKIVRESKRGRISYLQRKMLIGYNRAARLMEAMESEGIVSPPQINGEREVLDA